MTVSYFFRKRESDHAWVVRYFPEKMPGFFEKPGIWKFKLAHCSCLSFYGSKAGSSASSTSRVTESRTTLQDGSEFRKVRP